MLRFCRTHQALALPADSLEHAAAAVAIGLYLQGVRPRPDEKVAAAVGAALCLAQVRQQPPRRHPEQDHLSGWALSGRMAHMGVRMAQQEARRRH